LDKNLALTDLYKKELLSSIPVVSGMKIDIEKISDREIILKAPLDININYEGTAFGGSINTLCTLASYLLTHHLIKMSEHQIKSLVIQDSSIKYKSPVKDNFFAQAVISEAEKERFLSMLKRKKMGRVNLSTTVYTVKDEGLVEYLARFVAIIY